MTKSWGWSLTFVSLSEGISRGRRVKDLVGAPVRTGWLFIATNICKCFLIDNRQNPIPVFRYKCTFFTLHTGMICNKSLIMTNLHIDRWETHHICDWICPRPYWTRFISSMSAFFLFFFESKFIVLWRHFWAIHNNGTICPSSHKIPQLRKGKRQRKRKSVRNT